jgi:hypothetical protein
MPLQTPPSPPHLRTSVRWTYGRRSAVIFPWRDAGLHGANADAPGHGRDFFLDAGSGVQRRSRLKHTPRCRAFSLAAGLRSARRDARVEARMDATDPEPEPSQSQSRRLKKGRASGAGERAAKTWPEPVHATRAPRAAVHEARGRRPRGMARSAPQ